MDAANVVTSGEAARAADELSERDQQILAFERLWWKYAGAKEQAIREKFDDVGHPLLPGAQRPDRPSRGAGLRPVARQAAAPAPVGPPAAALGAPARHRDLTASGSALRRHPRQPGLRRRCRGRARRGRVQVPARTRRPQQPSAHDTPSPTRRTRRAGPAATKPKPTRSRSRRGRDPVPEDASSRSTTTPGITGLAAAKARLARGGRLERRRHRQLVRQHPGQHGLLPGAAARLRRESWPRRCTSPGLQPAVSPMQFDRLTVIFTSLTRLADYGAASRQHWRDRGASAEPRRRSRRAA